MASLRELKKDINYIYSEFVADCYLIIHMNPDNYETINTIADHVIAARNALVHLMHHPENKGKRKFNKNLEIVKKRNKEHKESIKKGFEEFLKLIDNSYEELKKLTK